jgi:hypothetical protein
MDPYHPHTVPDTNQDEGWCVYTRDGRHKKIVLEGGSSVEERGERGTKRDKKKSFFFTTQVVCTVNLPHNLNMCHTCGPVRYPWTRPDQTRHDT